MTAPTTESPSPEAPVPGAVVEVPVRGRAWARAALAADETTARPAWLVAPLAALWAAGIGIVVIALPMVVLWATSILGGTSIAGALRSSLLIWVVTHDVALRVGTATFSLLPWGVAIAWALLLAHAGRWAARASRVESVRDGAVVVVSIAVTYAAVLAGASSISATSDARTSPIRALGMGLVIAGIGATLGVLRGSELMSVLRTRVPEPAFGIARGALTGIAALIGLGALLAAISLLAAFPQALDMQRFLDPGPLGGLALLLLGIGYLPVAIMWSVAYLLGAGLAIGPSVVISPFLASPAPTQLPPFPLLAALPQQGSPLTWALPILGVLAGVAVGVVIARTGHRPALHRIGMVVAAVIAAAFVIAILARLSHGSLGDVRLVGLGPASDVVALLAGGLLLAGAVPSVLVAGRKPADVG